MTYNELRDYIDRFDAAGFVKEPEIAALRAVVELHKSVEDNRCEACYREEYFGGRHLEIGKYPCLTIQAIEKELA